MMKIRWKSSGEHTLSRGSNYFFNSNSFVFISGGTGGNYGMLCQGTKLLLVVNPKWHSLHDLHPP